MIKGSMQILEFSVIAEDDGYVARWDDPAGGGITTEGDSLAELVEMVKDAVDGYFDAPALPVQVELNFVQKPTFLVPA